MNAIDAIQQRVSISQPKGRRSRPEIHAGGHLFPYGLALCLAAATASECHSITHLPSLVYGCLFWFWWALVASGMWALSRRFPIAVSFTPRAIAVHLLAGSLLAYTHLMLLWSLGFVLGWSRESSDMMWRYLMNVNRFGIEILIYGFVFAITGVMQARLRAQSEAMRALELERQLSAAQLHALQMQLEPHFLFNTLNAITSLVDFGRQQQASEMLSHLNSILKSTLQRSAPQKVPLWQELEIVENYLAIEQVRFADRLRFDLRVDPEALDGLVPCFLLQPIMENAIRHGVAQCENASIIEASARLEGAQLQFRVSNTVPESPARSESSGHGIGLKNTRERLAHFYPERHAITAQTVERGGFEVAITIPYEPNLG